MTSPLLLKNNKAFALWLIAAQDLPDLPESTLKWFSKRVLRDDELVVLAMVRRQPMALRHASFRLRRNRDLVLAAFEQDPRALVCIDHGQFSGSLHTRTSTSSDDSGRLAALVRIYPSVFRLPSRLEATGGQSPTRSGHCQGGTVGGMCGRERATRKCADESRVLESHHSNFILCL